MKYLLLLLLLAGCHPSGRSIDGIIYGDRVEVVSGFYEGQKGAVTDSYKTWGGYYFLVELSNGRKINLRQLDCKEIKQ